MSSDDEDNDGTQARLEAVELIRNRLVFHATRGLAWDKERDPLWRLLNGDDGRAPQEREKAVLELLEAAVSLALSGVVTVSHLTGAPPGAILDALALEAMTDPGAGEKDVTVNW